MATSALPDAIDWCVDTFRAAATLGAAADPVLIVDGPEVIDKARPRILWVATDDVEELPNGVRVTSNSGTARQSWAGIGAQRKDELLSIPCVIRAWNGDGDVRQARTDAFGVLAAVENLARGNANLGGTVLVTLNGIDNLRLRTAVGNAGATADLAFTIDAKARI